MEDYDYFQYKLILLDASLLIIIPLDETFLHINTRIRQININPEYPINASLYPINAYFQKMIANVYLNNHNPFHALHTKMFCADKDINFYISLKFIFTNNYRIVCFMKYKKIQSIKVKYMVDQNRCNHGLYNSIIIFTHLQLNYLSYHC